MRAWTYARYGPPEVLQLEEVPRPVPRAGDVLIRVHATTVSSADWRLRSLSMPPGLGWAGRPAAGFLGPRRPILGTELSGTVVEVGAGAPQFLPGDPVVGFPGTRLGAHAEYATLPAAARVEHMPPGMTFEAAAAIRFAGTAAVDFLVRRGRVQPGEQVLIVGAGGAVGSACVQIAAHLGARVTGTCGADKAEAVLSLGARRVLDHGELAAAEGRVHYDVVVEAAGAFPWDRARWLVRPGGRMLLIAGRARDMILGPARARFGGRRLIAGAAREDAETLAAAVGLADRGALRPVVGRVFAFEDMIEAHAHVDAGHKLGAAVVVM